MQIKEDTEGLRCRLIEIYARKNFRDSGRDSGSRASIRCQCTIDWESARELIQASVSPQDHDSNNLAFLPSSSQDLHTSHLCPSSHDESSRSFDPLNFAASPPINLAMCLNIVGVRLILEAPWMSPRSWRVHILDIQDGYEEPVARDCFDDGETLFDE
ncbi:hypothetical protein SISSUDRAFT_1048319 [Sistotremastrum suecicum HHB10207 ss-3]|uniref:Uncharacterized protein n=1 Tax=Sistotremastrum suecicum HHB10207 ss-3 TaxID=1314776 RepID=A0A166CKZ5_9AGAM|nr:hypothetical protein SISSUDRAFT_1048319 [Sistotremastrum suecicum HHB10207 ss-3]